MIKEIYYVNEDYNGGDVFIVKVRLGPEGDEELDASSDKCYNARYWEWFDKNVAMLKVTE